MKLQDAKKIILTTGLSFQIALSMTACKPLEELSSRLSCENQTDSQQTETFFETEESSLGTETVTTSTEPITSETEITTVIPSDYDGMRNIAIPTEYAFDQDKIPEDDFMKNYYLYVLSNNDIPLSYLGDENQTSLERLRQVTRNPNITLNDCGYFQKSINKYDLGDYKFKDNGFSIFYEDGFSYLMSVARYILNQNELTFMVDKIPRELFEEKFPNYMNMIKNGCSASDLIGLPVRRDVVCCKSYSDVESLVLRYSDRNISEDVGFWSLYYYNFLLDNMSCSYKPGTVIKKDLRYNEDLGINMTYLSYTESQEETIREKLCEIPGYEHYKNKRLYLSDKETLEEICLSCQCDVSDFENLCEGIDGAKMQILKGKERTI